MKKIFKTVGIVIFTVIAALFLIFAVRSVWVALGMFLEPHGQMAERMDAPLYSIQVLAMTG